MTDTQQPSATSAGSGNPPPAKKSRIDLTAVKTARAVAFCRAIMTDLVDSAHNEIKGVMRNVPDPYSGTLRDVIVREDDYVFWNQLLDGLASEDVAQQKRVAAVGAPGVGKSTTKSFAIRLLLQQRKTVVYLQRTVDGTGHYIQFSPSDEDVQFDIELIPEKTSPSEIPSLFDPETYYLVDPGKNKSSCDPDPMVAARVIIVASPDERHWGGSAFTKHDQSYQISRGTE